MNKTYYHLTPQERDRISLLKAKGLSLRKIGENLKRDVTTILRELRRNSQSGIYLPHQAQSISESRNRESHQRTRLKEQRIVSYVCNKLGCGWSPELIAGRLSLEHPELRISHEAIYQWIYKRGLDFRKYLVRKRVRRLPRHYSRKPQTHYIPCRVGIENRPEEINKREGLGHWEVDTVGVGDYQETLHVMTERKTRYTLITRIERKQAEAARDAMIQRLRKRRRSLRKSFTYDNGQENCGHIMVNRKLGTRSYFCRPYHSWEKGSVENTIGIIRRFFPKGTNFKNVSNAQIQYVQEWLNRRPRKCLKFKTPFEILKASVALDP